MSLEIITAQQVEEAHKYQQHRLGIYRRDEEGRLWTYCHTLTDLVIGEWCEDMQPVVGGTVTGGGATAIGGSTLADTGEFANDDYVGAFIETIGDTIANGAAQGGWIKSMVGDDDTIDVEWDHNATGKITDGNVTTALVATTTTYTIYFPGRVQQGTAAPNLRRCVPQIAIDGSEKPYFWGLALGQGLKKIDVAGGAGLLVINEPIIAAAAGLGDGLTNGGTTADEVNYRVGWNLFGDLDGSVDGLQRTMIECPMLPVSMRFVPSQPRYS